MKKKLLIILLILLIPALLFLLAAPEKNSETLAAIVPTDVVAVAKGRVSVEGGIVRVAASRQGIVTSVHVEEGDKVTKGMILAQMDARQPELTLAVTKAELEQKQAALAKLNLKLTQAQRELRRMQSLMKSSAVSRQRFDTSKDQCDNLKAETQLLLADIMKTHREMDLQSHEIGQYTIRASLDGLVVRRMAQPGQGTSTTSVTDLFLILPDTKRIIRAEVEERFASLLETGMKADIIPQGADDTPRTGTILRIGKIMGARRDSALDPNERVDVKVVEVVLSFDPTEKQLIIGQRVSIRLRK